MTILSFWFPISKTIDVPYGLYVTASTEISRVSEQMNNASIRVNHLITARHLKSLSFWIFLKICMSSQDVFRWQPICRADTIFSQEQLVDIATLYDIPNVTGKSKKQLCDELEQRWKDDQVEVVNSKTQCFNDSNILMTEDVKDIPPEMFLAIQDGGKLWCFDVREMKQLVDAADSSKVSVKNPFTNTPLDLDMLEKKIKKAEKFVIKFDEDDSEDINLSPSSRLSIAIGNLLNVYSNESISGMGDPKYFQEIAKRGEIFEFIKALSEVSEYNMELQSLENEKNDIVLKTALINHITDILKNRTNNVLLYDFFDLWNSFSSGEGFNRQFTYVNARNNKLDTITQMIDEASRRFGLTEWSATPIVAVYGALNSFIDLKLADPSFRQNDINAAAIFYTADQYIDENGIFTLPKFTNAELLQKFQRQGIDINAPVSPAVLQTTKQRIAEKQRMYIETAKARDTIANNLDMLKRVPFLRASRFLAALQVLFAAHSSDAGNAIITMSHTREVPPEFMDFYDNLDNILGADANFSFSNQKDAQVKIVSWMEKAASKMNVITRDYQHTQERGVLEERPRRRRRI